jgi:[ribosomal protein S18]-alanine N-acetyltransferase
MNDTTSITYKILRPSETVGMIERDAIATFLEIHLDEYGDKKEDIAKCLDYALNSGVSPGGFAVTALDNDKIVGAVIVNRTGMEGYIPENILVYIAMHKDYRGHGIGKKLMLEAINNADGDIALHVEPDNPAKILYEKLGFTNKYLEMRLKK